MATTILKRSYSTGSVYKVLSLVSNIDNNESIKFDSLELNSFNTSFIEWFRGFTDALGAFLIECKEKLYYSFTFAITLHIDDVKVLNFIHETLGIGSVFVYTNVNQAIFKVRSQQEIQTIIDIFTHHPLNTTKQLNLLAFATAFKQYKAAIAKKDVVHLVENIRDSINSKRRIF